MSLLPHQYYEIKHYYQHKHLIAEMYAAQLKGQENKQIRFFNWWGADSHSMWLHDFIIKRGLGAKSNKTVALCSVFGEKEVLDLVDADVRIFFSGENLHNPRHAQYAGYMLEGKRPFDLGIGFDYFEDERYIRFPLWLTYMFAPDATEEDIRKRCESLRYPNVGERDKFAALIARADWNGIRGGLADKIAQYGDVKYPSAFRHNDDSLKDTFDDNKIAYLRQFKFNICPENTNAVGYVTEKLFESIDAGCVPIYWGAYDNPEPEVLNTNAIIMDVNQCNINEYDKLSKLPRLNEGAEDFVLNHFDQLERKIAAFFI